MTEKIEIVGAILKERYEKLNTTLEGLSEVKRMGGKSDAPEGDFLENDDYDDDDDGGDGDDGNAG